MVGPQKEKHVFDKHKQIDIEKRAELDPQQLVPQLAASAMKKRDIKRDDKAEKAIN